MTGSPNQNDERPIVSSESKSIDFKTVLDSFEQIENLNSNDNNPTEEPQQNKSQPQNQNENENDKSNQDATQIKTALEKSLIDSKNELSQEPSFDISDRSSENVESVEKAAMFNRLAESNEGLAATETNDTTTRVLIPDHSSVPDHASKKQKLDNLIEERNSETAESQNTSLQQDDKCDVLEPTDLKVPQLSVAIGHDPIMSSLDDVLVEVARTGQEVTQNEFASDLPGSIDEGLIGSCEMQIDTNTDDMLIDSFSSVGAKRRSKSITEFGKSKINYQSFEGYYPHEKEVHVLVITCQERYWNWALLEKGFGFQDIEALDEADHDSISFAPRLCWRTSSITENSLNDHFKKKEKDLAKSCELLNAYMPPEMKSELLYGRDWEENMKTDCTMIRNHRNQMAVPTLSVFVIASYESYVDDTDTPGEKTHMTNVNKLRDDDDKALTRLFCSVPTNMYRLGPKDIAMAHIRKTEVGGLDPATMKQVESTTAEQWLEVKSADISFGSRPALIIDGSEDGLVITATDSITLEDRDPISLQPIERKTLTIIGQNRTTSIRNRFLMLQSFIKYEELSGEKSKEDLITSIVTQLNDKSKSLEQSYPYSLFSKDPKFEAHAMILSEVALLLQSVARSWIASVFLKNESKVKISHTNNEEQPQVETAKQKEEKTQLHIKPIIIVTGTDRNILKHLIDPATCGHFVDFTTSSSNDEADYLRTVEIVEQKHLSVYGIASYLLDMSKASIDRERKQDNKTVSYHDLFGVRVAKYFDGTLFRGTVSSASFDNVSVVSARSEGDQRGKSDPRDYFFTVIYDDGDIEELDIQEISDLLANYVENFEENKDDAIVKKTMEAKRREAEKTLEKLKKGLYIL